MPAWAIKLIVYGVMIAAVLVLINRGVDVETASRIIQEMFTCVSSEALPSQQQ